MNERIWIVGSIWNNAYWTIVSLNEELVLVKIHLMLSLQVIFNQDIVEDQNYPSITIFTYNESSRLQILKHIHDMGINRQRLFNLCDFRIFRTDGSDVIRIEAFLKNRESERECSKRILDMLPNHDYYED